MATTAEGSRARRRRKGSSGRDSGSATVEVVLLTPLLIGLLFLVVLCGRLVSAQLDLDTAAHEAARAASLDRTVPAAQHDAAAAVTDTLAARHLTCQHPTLTLDTDGLQPGGIVTATVGCTVPLSDLALVGVPGARQLTAKAVSPIDQWRADGGPRGGSPGVSAFNVEVWP